MIPSPSYRRKGGPEKVRPLTRAASSPCCPPPSPPLPPPADDDEADRLTARLAKALAHPARVAIVRLLLREGACVCGDIVESLPLAQSTVSEHLRQLKVAGLIRGTLEGPRTCYCIETAALDLLRALLDGLEAPGPCATRRKSSRSSTGT